MKTRLIEHSCESCSRIHHRCVRACTRVLHRLASSPTSLLVVHASATHARGSPIFSQNTVVVYIPVRGCMMRPIMLFCLMLRPCPTPPCMTADSVTQGGGYLVKCVNQQRIEFLVPLRSIFVANQSLPPPTLSVRTQENVLPMVDDARRTPPRTIAPPTFPSGRASLGSMAGLGASSIQPQCVCILNDQLKRVSFLLNAQVLALYEPFAFFGLKPRSHFVRRTTASLWVLTARVGASPSWGL